MKGAVVPIKLNEDTNDDKNVKSDISKRILVFLLLCWLQYVLHWIISKKDNARLCTFCYNDNYNIKKRKTWRRQNELSLKTNHCCLDNDQQWKSRYNILEKKISTLLQKIMILAAKISQESLESWWWTPQLIQWILWIENVTYMTTKRNKYGDNVQYKVSKI